MFVKLKKDYDGHKAGDVIDIADDAIARSFVAAGVAEESSADAHMRAGFKAQLDEATRSLRDELAELKRTGLNSVPSNGPPSSGVDDGVEFNGSVEGTESPADRGVDGRNVARGLGEMLGLIARTSPKCLSADREHADQRLVEHFGLERVVNKEGVSRAGTESMSGGTTYGYFIKPEILGSYFEIAMEDSLIEPYAFPVPIGQTNELSWPALDQYFAPGAGQSAATAGIQVFRKSEIAQRQASDAKLRNVAFKINDLTGYTQVSRDLVADNYIAATTLLQSLFLKALNFKKDYEFVNATGGDRPIGIRQSPALITVARKQTGHIVFEDICKMLSVFDQSLLKGAKWIAHQSCYEDLLAIKNNAGNYVFQPNALVNQATNFSLISGNVSNGVTFSSHGVLNGLPIQFTSDKLEVLGTVGDFMLINPSQYGIANRAGVEVAVSDQFLFDTDQIAYRWKLRNDGQSLWLGSRQSTTPAGASFKTSPFVQVAT